VRRVPGRLTYQLTVRPRVFFECAGCGQQHSVTAGTVFHRTRTHAAQNGSRGMADGARQRGVSALFLRANSRCATTAAWLMAHKLRTC